MPYIVGMVIIMFDVCSVHHDYLETFTSQFPVLLRVLISVQTCSQTIRDLGNDVHIDSVLHEYYVVVAVYFKCISWAFVDYCIHSNIVCLKFLCKSHSLLCVDLINILAEDRKTNKMYLATLTLVQLLLVLKTSVTHQLFSTSMIFRHY